MKTLILKWLELIYVIKRVNSYGKDIYLLAGDLAKLKVQLDECVYKGKCERRKNKQCDCQIRWDKFESQRTYPVHKSDSRGPMYSFGYCSWCGDKL